MAELDISNATASDLKNTIEDYSVDEEVTDGATGQKEFSWQMTDWPKYLGYYKTIPELKVAVDTKAVWTMGAGFEADDMTTMILDNVKGHGKDTFNTILKNQQRVKTLAGDSFAEIITDKDNILANLKPLDPSSMRIITNAKGIIKRYEQVNKNKKNNKRFLPHQIFHLSRDRIADEIHGISVIPAVKWIIDARNEAMEDWKKVLHWNVFPRWKIALDTDDADEITGYKTKYDTANSLGENMYIPKGTVEVEVLGVAPNATLNPLAWIAQLNDYFFQVVNCPQIIIGNAKEFTDASGKIVYLAYEQSVKDEQLYMEEQVLAQLSLEINLTFPATLQMDTVSDTPNTELEEEPQEAAAQPNDTTSELEGKK